MTRYHKMTESEIDGILLLSFFPNKKEKLNLSNKENFVNLILKRLEENDLLSEFGENVTIFLSKDAQSKKEIGFYIYESFIADIKVYKMAALKTFDEFREFIK